MWKFKLMVFISTVVLNGIAGLTDKNITLWDYTASPEDIRDNHIELMKLYMNTTVDPCDDFYEYSCGNWQNANELHSSDEAVPSVLHGKIQQVLKELVEDPSEDGDDNEQAMKLFYKSCMNTTIIMERGNQPVIDFLQTLDGWPIVDSESSNENVNWFNLSVELALYDYEYIFTTYADLDVDDAVLSPVIRISPSYNYFRYDKEEFENVTTFIIGEALSDTIWNELKEFHAAFERFGYGDYEKASVVTLEELTAEEPHIDWEQYLSILLNKPVYSTQVVKAPVNNLKKITDFLLNTPSRKIANYILYNTMLSLYKLTRLTNTRINFIDGGDLARDEYCSNDAQRYFSIPLTKMFVNKYLDESANERAIELSEQIREAFSEFIGNIFWIDEPTKQIALQKVNSIHLNVGYKAKYFENVNYPDLNFEEYFENSMKLKQHTVQTYWFEKLGDTESRNKFVEQYHMAAFFKKEKNTAGEVHITAAMLQPPLFNNYIPNWANFGGIGYIIGHELTHGFNTYFLKARENETDSEWWSPNSFKEYMIRTLCYNFQYDKYKFEDMEISVHGQNTLNENMADNGGLKFGYEAYKKWLSNHENSDEKQVNPVLNLNGEQLYFVSFAQTLCSSENKVTIQRTLEYDSHTPPKYRVIGSVTNSFDFAKAFQCPIGSAMHPPRKCRF